MSKKIEIDLAKLDGEINSSDERILNWQNLIEQEKQEQTKKKLLRDYILENYTHTPKKRPARLKPELFPEANKKPERVLGLGDFIRKIVKETPGIHTTQIARGYAIENDIADFKTILVKTSKTLSRLKTEGYIENILKDGARRSGSTWTSKE